MAQDGTPGEEMVKLSLDSPRDDLILAALLDGCTYEEAARRSQTSMSTVNRRVADPVFRRKLRAARADLQDRALTTLHHAATAGVRALLEAVTAPGPYSEETLDGDGNVVRVRHHGVPWTAKVSAGRALAELSLGVIARQQGGMSELEAEEFDSAALELGRKIDEVVEGMRHVRVIEASAAEPVKARNPRVRRRA